MAKFLTSSPFIWHTLTRLVPLAVAAVLPAVADDALAIGKTVFRIDAECRRPTYNLTWPVDGPAADLAPGGQALAVLFAFADPQHYCRIDLADGRWSVTRVAGGDRRVLGAGEVDLPPDASLGELTLVRRQRHLGAFFGGRLLFRFSDSGDGTGTAASWSSGGITIGHPRRQPVVEDEMVFSDDFTRAPEEPDEGVWQVDSGEWGLQSYVDQWRGDSPMDIDNTSRNANPFVYRGTGTPDAMAVAGQTFWDDVTVSVSVRPQTGGAGLVVGWHAPDDYYVVRWEPSAIWEKPSRLALERIRGETADVLAEAFVAGQRHQWVRLGVECRGPHLAVCLQGATVLRAADRTFRGGKVGLCAFDGAVDFDDVRVRPSTFHPFVEDALQDEADVWPDQAWTWTDDGARCELRKGGTPNASLAIGMACWQPQRIAVTAEPSAGSGATVGVCFGTAGSDAAKPSAFDRALGLFGSQVTPRTGANAWPGPVNAPLDSYVFLWDPATATTPTCRLLRRERRKAEVLAEFPGGYPLGRPLRLLVNWVDDALEIREAMEGLLLRIPHYASPAGRISVLAGGSEGSVAFRDLVIDGPSERDWERPVATQVFMADHYMLDWAAPEGDWVPDVGTAASGTRWWHKGDFYGALSLSLPLVATQTGSGARLFLGATEEHPEAGYDLALRPIGSSGRRFRATLSCRGSILTTKSVRAGEEAETVQVHRDGPFIWLRCGDDEPLFVRPGDLMGDAVPPRGTRVGLELPWAALLDTITLRRDHVMDDQFDRAAVHWRDVGRWEMSNKFACDPRWGYMVGESDGLASLWHTDSFPGDMTLEFYAGMRYRPKYYGIAPYYPRPGDINASFAGSAGNVFDGYAAIVSGWDTTWTRFMKQGRIVAETDRPLVPSTRRAYPKPQDLHRRWFYVKVRRHGPDMELYFDNEKVLNWRDDAPMPTGRIGLWTYDNSIVLARVKVSYSRRERFCPTAVPKDEPPVVAAPAQPSDADSTDARELLTKYTFDAAADLTAWHETGDTGDAMITWSPDGHEGGCLRAVNAHAGGEFRVPVPFPELDVRDPRSRIAFLVKLTPDTRINLYATIAGKQHFLHITGPDESDENLVCLGHADVATDGTWQPVTISLGEALLRLQPMEKTLPVKDVYFGVSRGAYLLAGLGGNPAGAEFALDDVEAVLPESPMAPAITATTPETGARWGGQPIKIQFQTPNVPLWGLTLTAGGKAHTLADRALDYDFDSGTLVFDPVAASLTLVHDQPVAFSIGTGDNGSTKLRDWQLVFDRQQDVDPPTPVRVSECLVHDTFEKDMGAWKRLPADSKGRENSALLVRDASRAASGRYSLKLFNESMGGDAGASITAQRFHGGRHALLTFDCLMEREVLTDILLVAGGRQCRITLTDNTHRNSAVALGKCITDLAPDGKWHRVAINLRSALFAAGGFDVSSLRIGDYAWTGNPEGATYWIDNMRLTPCYSSAGDGFSLSWGESRDASGIAGYSFHWSQEEREDADETPEGDATSATFTSLPDGPNYFHVRAVDAQGNWGDTTDWLVLIDNTAPAIASVWPEPGNESASTNSGVVFSPTLSPGLPTTAPLTDIDPASIRLTVNDRVLSPAMEGVLFDPHANSLTVDWLAAGLLEGVPEDGQAIEVKLEPIRDFVGNECEGVSWTWTFRRRLDSRPPLAPEIRWQDGTVLEQITMESPKKAVAASAPLWSKRLVEEGLGTHVQQFRLGATGISITATVPGKIDAAVHRYLSFRYRFPPDLKADLVGSVQDEDKERQSMVIKLTDAEVRPDYVTLAGRVDGVACDDAWHCAVVDLQHHMRSREHLAPDAQIDNWTISSIRFADYGYNWNDLGTTFYLDDIVIFGDGPAEARFALSATDESGISGYACTFSRDPDDVPTDEINVTATESYHVSFPSSGLWYIHARTRDAAGNWSKAAHLPYVRRDP